ncbi:MAG: SDR family oxidoreductase [Parcubacteria group bacterium]|nr:SDR family oxidoreductase [Parcubacteria group bacterium]
MNLKNKIVFILGGTGSIGSAVGDAFAAHGATVCRHGPRGEYKADVRKSKETARVIMSALKKHGKIDILVNAVSAPVSIAPFEKKEWRDFSKHLDVQLKSAVETAQLVIPSMREQGGGAIIHVLSTSVGGRILSSTVDYITAKYALWGLTRALAKDLGRYRITVNAVSPSFIANDFTKHAPAKLHDFFIHDTPIGRLALPEDVAHAVVYLASPESRYITGENVQVSGGHHL